MSSVVRPTTVKADCQTCKAAWELADRLSGIFVVRSTKASEDAGWESTYRFWCNFDVHVVVLALDLPPESEKAANEVLFAIGYHLTTTELLEDQGEWTEENREAWAEAWVDLFQDTAEKYGLGHGERLVDQALACAAKALAGFGVKARSLGIIRYPEGGLTDVCSHRTKAGLGRLLRAPVVTRPDARE